MSSKPIIRSQRIVWAVLALCLGGGLQAQSASAEGDTAGKAAAGAPAPLIVLFAVGSSTLRAEDKAVLDRASRAYSEGKPIVMILTGSSDRVGSPQQNLSLSQHRAAAVLKGLLERGIPADRFQILAKGETEPAVPNKEGQAEPQNRRVEISWH